MNRVWTNAYPAGVPPEIDAGAYHSLNALFDRTAATYADRTAFFSLGASLTYAELDRLSAQFASYLQNVVRLHPGARVALMLPNLLQYPVAMFGILRAGCVVVNCNPLYTAHELHHQLKDSGAEAIVAFENRAFILQEALEGTDLRSIVVTQAGDLLGFARGTAVNFAMRMLKRAVPAWHIAGAVTFQAALKEGAAEKLVPVDIEPEDIAFLQYTGGTTGVPKGAILTHFNMVANLQQCHAWLAPFLTGDRDPGQEIVITALPLYHVFALTCSFTFFKVGAENVLVADPRNIRGLVAEMRQHKFTAFTGVNTLFNALLNNPDFAKLDFSRLTVSLGGGMAIHRAVAERWKQVTGHTLIEAYGLSETSPAVTGNPLDIAAFNGSIGLPLPSTDVAIRDEAGAEVASGEVGELCVQGPQVMQGYWHKPEETTLVFTPDRYLRTGDLATMDENGFVRIVDRRKDMIISSGFNIYPNEVEDVVAMHPGVLEVGAVGVPDPVCGETVRIVVVRKDPALTAADLISHCRRFLTGYKVPRTVDFAESLPKNAIGKILRRELRVAT
jgi:long-chain acyl-CoA synthetase